MSMYAVTAALLSETSKASESKGIELRIAEFGKDLRSNSDTSARACVLMVFPTDDLRLPVAARTCSSLCM